MAQRGPAEIAAVYRTCLPSGSDDEAARTEAGRRIAEIGNAENESFGIELGYAYADSPVICADPGAQISKDPLRYVPTTAPGVRLPSIVLPDGVPIFDRLGRWFTLVCVGASLGEALRRPRRGVASRSTCSGSTRRRPQGLRPRAPGGAPGPAHSLAGQCVRRFTRRRCRHVTRPRLGCALMTYGATISKEGARSVQISEAMGVPGRSHSCNLDQRRRPDAPASTTQVKRALTPVSSGA